MTQYDDIFIRDDLSDTGQIPTNFSGSTSPDIIPQVQSVDPNSVQAMFGSATYSNGRLGQNIEAGQSNYIYVRAKNLYSQASTATFNLYYAPGNTYNQPELWRNNLAGTTQFDSIPAGSVMAAPQPVIWLPPTETSMHFCLIGQIVTPRHPNPIPASFSGTNNWYRWASNNPGVAYRNVTVVNNVPDTGTEWDLRLINPDSTSRLYVIEVVCTNCPVNSLIKIYCPSDDIQPPIDKTYNIPQPTYSVSTSGTLPGNFSNKTIVTFQPPQAVSSNANVRVKQWTEVLEGEDFMASRAIPGHKIGPHMEEIVGSAGLVCVGEYTFPIGS